VTHAGVPILFPVPTGRRMWRMVGIPNAIAVKVGGKVEVFVLRTVFTVVALIAIAGLYAPTLLHRIAPSTWAGPSH
jgi:hypothetical protein